MQALSSCYSSSHQLFPQCIVLVGICSLVVTCVSNAENDGIYEEPVQIAPFIDNMFLQSPLSPHNTKLAVMMMCRTYNLITHFLFILFYR